MLAFIAQVKEKQIEERKPLRDARAQNERKARALYAFRAEKAQEKEGYADFCKLLEHGNGGAF
jgi:hypothetical protein